MFINVMRVDMFIGVVSGKMAVSGMIAGIPVVHNVCLK